ncbi:MAG: ATP-binding protein [Actinobacteria bacterium]|nr:ATP-binding protein [Actinomycetota bacterium]
MQINNNLSEEEIIDFLNLKTETKNIDFKEDLDWNFSSKTEKIKIIKDILAMGNTQDGGVIIFGVRDSDYEFIGLGEQSFDSFDQTKVNDLLYEYSDPKFTCQVYKIIFQKLIYTGKRSIVIIVPEFNQIPIICKKDFDCLQNKILKRGEVYIRTEKANSESVSSSYEMHDLIQRAMLKSGDKLLKNIELLIKGQSPIILEEEALKKIEDEISEGLEFLKDRIGKEINNYGYWQFISYPSAYTAERFEVPKQIDDLIKKSEVNLLGWNLPHTDHNGNASNFIKGRQSFTTWEEFIEGYRAYFSGLFIWQRAFVEDTKLININDKPVLEFIRTIRYVTEILFFLKRFYAEISEESDLALEITLKNLLGRQIYTTNPTLDIWQDYYISKEKNILIKKKISFIDLKINWLEIANEIIRKIFMVFNADDITENTIKTWQEKILKKDL